VTSVALLAADGRATQVAEIGEMLANQEIKPHLIHETVVAEMAWRRAGTHSTKTRAQVSGGGRKPWRQKGSGRARAGSTRSPIWTGGGVVFGPQPRSHGGKVNKKIRAQAFRSALRAHVERGTVAVMDDPAWDTPSTKRAVTYLDNAPVALEARPLLVVVDDLEGVVARSFRNVSDVYVLDCWELETVDIMSGRSMLVEREAWDRIGGELGATTTVEPPAKAPKPKKVAPPKKKAVKAPVEDAPAEEAVIEEAAEVAAVETEEKPKPKPKAQPKAAPADADATEDKPKAKPKAKPAAKADEPAAEGDDPKPKRARAKKADEPVADADTEETS
jgi:large subunit ribosomal protein L4